MDLVTRNIHKVSNNILPRKVVTALQIPRAAYYLLSKITDPKRNCVFFYTIKHSLEIAKQKVVSEIGEIWHPFLFDKTIRKMV